MNKANRLFRRSLKTGIILILFGCNCFGVLAQTNGLKEVEMINIETTQPIDTLQVPVTNETLEAIRESNIEQTQRDSIQVSNKQKLDELNKQTKALEPKVDHSKKFVNQWRPNPTKATWYAIVFPGGGQIYNKKYWKLPIIYGGFAGCAYALNWNNTMYKDYAQAYRDLLDGNPNTNSYLELLPPNASIDQSRLESLLKNRKDRFRRYRDLSIIAFIGVYALSIIDAYVDAELSNFDISPDLSLRIEPIMFKSDNTNNKISNNNVGIQCKLTF